MGLFGKAPTVKLSVEGMTCGHCAARVTKALEALPGVKKVNVDLTKKEAEVTLTKKGSQAVERMTAAVKDAGYEATAK